MKLLLTALFCLTLSATAEEVFVKTYKVSFVDPEEIVSIAPMMMPSTNGLAIHAVDRKIVVKGTADQHEMVQSMIRDLDTAPKNIQVNVKFDRTGKSKRRSGSISNGGFSGSLRNSSVEENTTQMLVAMDGKRASLRVGETVPHLTWLTQYGYRHGYVTDVGIEWTDVGSSLAIEPEIVGTGLIRLRVTPELSGRLPNGKKHRIQYTHLATELVVADGQSVQIGGFSNDEEFSSKFFLGGSSGSESSTTSITLTPQILQ